MKGLWWVLLLVLLGLCGAGAYFLFLVLFDAGDAFPTTEDRRAGAWVVLGLTILSAGLATLLRRWRPGTAPGTPRLDRRLERKILAYARKSGGRVTVAEVALNARCTVQEAEAGLKELERQGIATVLYTANMDAVYVIGGFDEQAQAQAQDILNTPGGKKP